MPTRWLRARNNVVAYVLNHIYNIRSINLPASTLETLCVNVTENPQGLSGGASHGSAIFRDLSRCRSF
ncbi:hypothetical protein DTO046C5_3351 [Penicillium roqueforti]|nr:hypothetical protein DTO046C5_3351 [Penicillium roqueforti]